MSAYRRDIRLQFNCIILTENVNIYNAKFYIYSKLFFLRRICVLGMEMFFGNLAQYGSPMLLLAELFENALRGKSLMNPSLDKSAPFREY